MSFKKKKKIMQKVFFRNKIKHLVKNFLKDFFSHPSVLQEDKESSKEAKAH